MKKHFFKILDNPRNLLFMVVIQHSLYLNKHDVKVSKFVLKHVLKRMRGKGVFKIYQGHYSRTGKRMPSKKRVAKKEQVVKKEK